MSREKYTPEEIIKILRSITKVEIVDGKIATTFEDDVQYSYATEFTFGSFTRDLLELIEWHLTSYDETEGNNEIRT